MLPRCEGLGDETGPSEVLEVPFGCALGLPGPEDPAGMLFISVQLSLDVVFQVRLVDIEHAVDGSYVLVVAVSIISSASRKCSIVSGTLAKAVQPFRTIGLCTGPFADDGPLVGSCDFGTSCTGSLDVVAGLHGNFSIGEDLVDVGVEDNVVDSTLGIHEAVPVRLDVFECVVDDNSCGAILGADISPAIVVEFLQRIHVNTPVCRLIQELNCGHNISVTCVAVGEILDCRQCLGGGVALLPSNGSITSTVVEAVLGSRSCVALDDIPWYKQNINLPPCKSRRTFIPALLAHPIA
jgi:hypothetical protein